MQILLSTPAGMYKVDKSRNILGTRYLRLIPIGHFGIIRGLVTSFCQASKLVQCSWICIMAESDNSDRLGMFNNRYSPMEGGGGVEVPFYSGII